MDGTRPLNEQEYNKPGNQPHTAHNQPHDKVDEHLEEVRNVAEDAKQSAQRTAEEVKQQAKQAADSIKHEVGEAQEQVKRKGEELLSRGKERVASEIGTYGGAIRRAAEKLEEDSDTGLASFVHRAADMLERAEQHLQNRDVKSLVRELETGVRKQPEIVYGGLFLAGLALARFIKASSRANDYEDAGYQGYRDSGSRDSGRSVPLRHTTIVSPVPTAAATIQPPMYIRQPRPMSR